MNDFFSSDYFGNPAIAWLKAFIFVVSTVILSKIFFWILSLTKRRLQKGQTIHFKVILIDLIEEPFIFILTVLGIRIGLKFLELGENTQIWIVNISSVLYILFATWLIVRILRALVERFILPLADKSDPYMGKQLLPVLNQVSLITVWAIGIILALNNVGFNVGALLAGLGIGGLAVAMAGKDTISNIFGGITVFVEKPFKVDDIITISTFTGKILKISLRSTRMRTPEGKVVIIPNSKFIDSIVENTSMRPSVRILSIIKIPYNTKTETIKAAMEIMRNVVKNNQDTLDDVTVALTDFYDLAWGIQFIYFIKNEAPLAETQSAINEEITKMFEENGINIGLPFIKQLI